MWFSCGYLLKGPLRLRNCKCKGPGGRNVAGMCEALQEDGVVGIPVSK